MSNWRTYEVDLRIVTKLQQTVAAMKGIMEAAAVTADVIGQVLETLSPVYLLQKASAALVDKSAIAELIIGALTSLNKDAVELYPFIPIHESDRTRHPDTLLTLFIDSLMYRHLATVGAYVPGATSPTAIWTVQEPKELDELKQIDLGIGPLSRFSGFVMMSAVTDTNYGSTVNFYRQLILTRLPGEGRFTRLTPRLYSMGKLITPISIPTGRVFNPVWRAISSVAKTTGLLRGASKVSDRVKRLGVMLQKKADALRKLISELDGLIDIINALPDENTLAMITFTDVDIQELRDVLFSDGRPGGTSVVGVMGIVADPGVTKFLDLIGK